MTDNDFTLGMSRKARLRAEVTYLMLKGAGYAALVVVVAWLSIAVLDWFGRAVLPEDARTAADPAPQAFVDFAARARAADMPAPAAEPAAMDAAPAEEPAAEPAATDAAPAEEPAAEPAATDAAPAEAPAAEPAATDAAPAEAPAAEPAAMEAAPAEAPAADAPAATTETAPAADAAAPASE
jgi:hypothetical protein